MGQIERLVTGGAVPTFLRGTVFGFDDFVEDDVPGAAADFGVAGGEIGSSDLAVDERLLLGLVTAVQQPFGSRGVSLRFRGFRVYR